jgi:hypothetical protein
MMRIFDWLFVNQLFRTTERGDAVFYPNGVTGRGYLLPPSREAEVRGGVRRLVLLALASVLAVVVIAPRLIEGWMGAAIPLGWFVGGALAVLVIETALIIRALARLTEGLEPLR